MKRREFITKSTLIGASVPLAMTTSLSLNSCSNESKSKQKELTPQDLGQFSFIDIAPDGKPIKAALVGCGDRGTGAACQLLEAAPNISIVALADVFEDRMNGCRRVLNDRFNNSVEDNKCYIGFDSYKDIMLDSDIDLVLLCTPTHFRPVQFKAAKHVFMEKPCAIDPVGIRTVVAASKVAT